MNSRPESETFVARTQHSVRIVHSTTTNDGENRLQVGQVVHRTGNRIGTIRDHVGKPPGLHSYEVMMVAAHQEDLRAAQVQGMQAAFVPRPLEQGPHLVPALIPDPTFEVVATDFMDLAQQLGT